MKVCEHITLAILYCLMLFPAAPCLSNDCNTCASPNCVTEHCNCYSDCYEHGNCCPDVAHVENCLGEYIKIFSDVIAVHHLAQKLGSTNSCGV